MALKTDIQGIVKNTMDMLLGFGLGSKVDYTLVSNVSYNPTTGSVSPTTVSYTNKTAVLTTFSAEEKTEDVVLITDRKALIAFNDLPYVLTTNDYFIDTKTGARWEVRRVMGFPGEPVHKLHVRKV